jgi:hypothetical protein
MKEKLMAHMPVCAYVRTCRRMGIALRLVEQLEEWLETMGAEYAYMATDKCNAASLQLFTGRCGYSKFRTPSVLVHPVHSHRLRASVVVTLLGARDAERLYRARFANAVEFFPEDIGAVLAHPLSRGTFLATVGEEGYEWRGAEEFLATPPEPWAVDERAVRARPVPPGVVRVRPRRGRCSRRG